MIKIIEVCDVEQYDRNFPPERVADFIAWLKDQLATIPEEHRDSATIEITSHASYEDTAYAHVKIAYTREETADETELREGEARRSVRARRAWLENELKNLG